MKNLKILFPLSALTIIVFSCKKNKEDAPDPTPTPAPVYSDYSQLKVGNYWVYQEFEVDSVGNSTPKTETDSCYIEKDTVINNNTYYKMHRPSSTGTGNDFTYERDSLHYIVTSSGTIIFSSQDFTTVFESYFITAGPTDTIAQKVVKMEDRNVLVSTPAGNFFTSDYRITYNMYPNWSLNGNTRSMHTRYAINKGIVIETLPVYSGNPKYIERRLIRYHLN